MDDRLIPMGTKKKKGKMRRRVLVLREAFLSMVYLKIIIEEKLPFHNLQIFGQH
jgi:hypothetical protein